MCSWLIRIQMNIKAILIIFGVLCVAPSSVVFYPSNSSRLCLLIFSFISLGICLALHGFPGGSLLRICLHCGRPASIPRLGGSPGEGNGYPLQYSGLENSMDSIIHGATKRQTWLRDFHFHTFTMAVHDFPLTNP